MRRITLPLFVAIALSACASTRNLDKPPVAQLDKLEKPAASNIVGSNNVEELLVSGNYLTSEALSKSDPLPDVMVRDFSFTDASVYDVVKMLSKSTGIPVTFLQEEAPIRTPRTALTRTTKPLPVLMRDLSRLMGFFYEFEGGVIQVRTDQQFLVPIPPVNDLMETIPKMVEKLGATRIMLDKSSRTLTYVATRSDQQRIEKYLSYLRDNKSLIVYDTYIWEVLLSDSSALGIKWNDLKIGIGKTPATGPRDSISVTGGTTGNTTGGLTTNLIYNSADFSMDMLLSFLASQGTVNSLSQPRLALISGGIAHFHDGSTVNYVSEVGSVVSNSTTNTTVTTDKVLSGVDMALAGDVSEGSIYTDVRVSVSDLIRFNPFTALGTTLNLPQISSREVKTQVRARSGDTILLAGISVDRASRDLSGVPGLGNAMLLTAKDKAKERRELVIVLRPRVVSFKVGSPSQAERTLPPAAPTVETKPPLAAPTVPATTAGVGDSPQEIAQADPVDSDSATPTAAN